MPREHTMPVISEARRLADDGLRPTAIQRALSKQGHSVAYDTIRSWVVPGYAEERAANKRAQRTAGRERIAAAPDAFERLERLRTLRLAGLSYAGCSTIARVDFGVDVDPDRMRSLLKSPRPRVATVAVLEGGPTVRRGRPRKDER